jgi:periplasmic protein TonB
MFSGLTVAEEYSTRRRTAVLSFTLQTAAIAVVLTLPLLYPQSLPQALLNRRVFVPISRGDARAQASANASPTGAQLTQRALVVRPDFTHRLGPNESAGPIGPSPPILEPCLSSPCDPNSVFRTLSGPEARVIPRPPQPTRQFRQSVIMEGNLIHRVQPEYPFMAKQLRLQGAVVLKAVISREGVIEQAIVITGPDLLARSALAAVRQWRYRPYYLNHEPIEVETQITVNFVLER